MPVMAQIKDLRNALTVRIMKEPTIISSEQHAVLRGLVTELERRLRTEASRKASVDAKLAATQAALARECSARTAAERDRDAMRQELELIEASLDQARCANPVRPEVRLDGVVLLYVGGRPNQVAPMRAVVERLGATYLHHDGGIENHPTLLPGLASQSSVVLFPVDCISHDAANAVKALCRQSGKTFIPLRSSSLTSLLSALQRPEVAGLSEAAD